MGISGQEAGLRKGQMMSDCPKCKRKGHPVNLETKEYYCHKCGTKFTDMPKKQTVEDIMSQIFGRPKK